MKKQYEVGIDVGLNSTGLAAIEIDENNNPVRILKAISVIHDGGVDPGQQKRAFSRMKQAGIARRTRRMRRRRHARLQRLDNVLERLGYPLTSLVSAEGDSFEPWFCRAKLADSYIENEEKRKEAFSIAIRHIARHRGWRNPYKQIRTLHDDNPLSEQYNELAKRFSEKVCSEKVGREADISRTPGQIIRDYIQSTPGAAPRLRTSTTKEGMLPTRLMQEDNAFEIRKICEMQRVSKKDTNTILDAVFDRVSPKGSAQSRVGSDPLTHEPRASKASLAFQKFRIAATVANLWVHTADGDRALTVDEKRKAFDKLADQNTVSESLTWIDIADELGINRHDLKGIGGIQDDGERISNRPPRLDSIKAISKISNKSFKKSLFEWWGKADECSQEAMLELLGNSVDIDAVRDRLEYADPLDFIDQLDDAQLGELDKVSLPSGRASYSMAALKKLTDRMLSTNDNLHDARIYLYNVPSTWRPSAAPIGEPVGNPAVDRVLKIVNRFLMNCQDRWGSPQSVNIEHTRQGFHSASVALKLQRETEARAEHRQSIFNDIKGIKGKEGETNSREYDIRRMEAVQRQNGKCLYCGNEISFGNCEMDHIVPRKGIGATNTRTNLAAVCSECNRLKSNIPFASWCEMDAAKERDVDLKEAIDRVNNFIFTNEYSAQARKNFKKAVISRLKQTTEDEGMDNRSIESVAWMADELHRRIDWFFNSSKYMDTTGEESGNLDTKVRVYAGFVTGIARRYSGIDGRIHFIGAHYKTRLDRRHHAVDACVIALMEHTVAEVLVNKAQLRKSQEFMKDPKAGDPYWKDYPGQQDKGFYSYQQWQGKMYSLLGLMNDALDNDRIPVLRDKRLRLGNSRAHDDTIQPLDRVRLGEKISNDQIRKASTPALYTALVREKDYDTSSGLPENPNRVIHVNGRIIHSDEEIAFFRKDAAQIKVGDGSAEIGNSIHHARLYRCWNETKKGKKEEFFGMVRVFQADLLKARDSDLFAFPLAESSVSMRYANKSVSNAVKGGRAEYIGSFCVGDEIALNLSAISRDNESINDYRDFILGFGGFNNYTLKHWVISGYEDTSRINLRPSQISAEGLSSISISKKVEKILNKSWRISINTLANYDPIVIRRNAFGEERWDSKNGMLTSYRWKE